MPVRKQFVHVLIAASYEGELIPSRMLSDVVSDRVISLGEEMQQIITYQMPYSTSPMACGLKDVWDKMDDYKRELFAERYPDLATAIALMVGVENEQGNGTGTGVAVQSGEEPVVDGSASDSVDS